MTATNGTTINRTKKLGKLPGALPGSAQKYKRKQKSSTRAGGYRGVNILKEMDRTHNALINLAMSDTADRKTMMSKCKTIAKLTKTVADLTWQLQQATTVYNRVSGMSVDRQTQSNPKWVNPTHVRDVGGYFWTHVHCA